MGFRNIPPEGGLLSTALNPRHRIAKMTPMFNTSRAQEPDQSILNEACERHKTGQLALSKVAKKVSKRKTLVIKKKAEPADIPSGDFVLDSALKMAGKRSAPWE